MNNSNFLGYMAIDQYGDIYHLKTEHPRKELLEIFGRKKAAKMYVDNGSGHKHIGYVIAGHWLTIYAIHEWQPRLTGYIKGASA